ncbi:MAG TPA: hypothetical protein VFE27_16115 [Acidobacteriaceae bacterium]|jgi:hypothetical protein|nr:hypothetical protein [Acidobacteriaceae bacterium]
MSILSAVLFIHVLSAMTLFAAFALEAVVLLRIRSSLNVEHARVGVLSFHRLRGIAMPAFVGVLGSGLYLAYLYGGGTAWIPASLIAILLIMLVGGTVTGIRMAPLKKLLSTAGEAVAIKAILAKTQDRALVLSYGFRVGLAVGIVFLMTAKPGLRLSVGALAGAALAGVILVAGLSHRSEHGSRSVQNQY